MENCFRQLLSSTYYNTLPSESAAPIAKSIFSVTPVTEISSFSSIKSSPFISYLKSIETEESDEFVPVSLSYRFDKYDINGDDFIDENELISVTGVTENIDQVELENN
jgi:Ca2+-binding EF-hand superfamily protein